MWLLKEGGGRNHIYLDSFKPVKTLIIIGEHLNAAGYRL